jgi:hypothetical protein
MITASCWNNAITAPLGSPGGERGGVTIHSNGRMDANDGSEVCWIEPLSKFEKHLPQSPER